MKKVTMIGALPPIKVIGPCTQGLVTTLAKKIKTVLAQWWSWILAPVFITILGIEKLRRKKIIITVHNVKPHKKEFYKVFLNNSIIIARGRISST